MTSTTMKEMSYTELSSQIQELKQQQQALADKLNEMVSEMEHRKEQAINNWKLHTAMVLEDTKVLLEMGIEPQSLIGGVREDMDCSKQSEPTCDETPCETTNKGDDNTDTLTSDDDSTENTSTLDAEDRCLLLIPFHQMVVETCDQDTKYRLNPTTGKRMVSKLYMPFHQLCSTDPIPLVLKLGNKKARWNYPDPDESRVYSADGIAPTLTRQNCDHYIYVSPRLSEEEQVSETMSIAA